MMRRPFRTVIVLATAFFAVMFCSAGVAQTNYVLKDTAIVYRLDTHVDVLIDSIDRLSLTDILKPYFQKKFTPSTGGLTFGYLTSPVWLRIRTSAASPRSHWLLEI